MAALAAAYFLAAELGLSLPTVRDSVPLVRIQTGLALAALLLFGARLWPGVALGAFLANALTAAGPAAAAGIALGSALEAVAGVLLLRRLAGFRTFERPYDAVAFVLLGAALSPVVGATIGAGSLGLADQTLWPTYGFVWSAWWLGNAVSVVVVAPLLVAFATPERSYGSGRTAEAVALLLLLVGVAYGVFGGGFPLTPDGFPFAYALFPFVIWGALAFGLRGAAAATAVIFVIAIWATLLGHGPFAGETVTRGLILLQTFVGVVALTGLVLSAALAHRNRIQESVGRLAAIVESSDDAIIGNSPEELIVSWNRGARQIYGYTADEVIGTPISILVPPERMEELSWIMQRVLSGEHIRHYETVRLKKDGTWLHVSLSVWPIKDHAGRVVRISTIARDITEQKAAEAALEQANADMARWVNDLRDKTHQAMLLGEMGNLLQSCRTSAEAYAVFRQFIERLFPKSAGVLGLLTESKDAVEAVAVWGDEVGEEVFSPDACWALRRGRTHTAGDDDAALFCDHVSAKPAPAYVCVPMIAAGQPLGLLHVRPDLYDVGERTREASEALESCRRLAESTASQVALTLTNVKLQETLRGQAIRDPLTGLFNRRYLEESLERELHRAIRNDKPLGIIMMDIDHFKPFNDAYGHELGDLLLASLGNFLRTQVREQDIVCRYGGEEFTLILPEADLDATLHRAHEIRDGVRALDVPSESGGTGSVTVSLGVASYPEHGSTRRALLAAADAALYKAKEQGRDRPAVAARAAAHD